MATSSSQVNGEGDPRRVISTGIEPIDRVRGILRGQSLEVREAVSDLLHHVLLHPRLSREQTSVLDNDLATARRLSQSPDPFDSLGFKLTRLKLGSENPLVVELATELNQSLDSHEQERVDKYSQGLLDTTQDQVIATLERTGPVDIEGMSAFLYGIGIAKVGSDRRKVAIQNKTIQKLIGYEVASLSGVNFEEVTRRTMKFALIDSDRVQAAYTRSTETSDSLFNSYPVMRESVGVAFILTGRPRQEDTSEIGFV